MELDSAAIGRFRRTVWAYFAAHRRDMPWRHPEPDGTFDPYKILVSEVMLQQTQVPRVIPKFELFIDRFPSVEVLAAAPLSDVLKLWSGLGYNRRAKFLHQAATEVVKHYHGQFPQIVKELKQFSGVGENTAGAIAVYAFNQPVIFIETNIRTVYIHHFFEGRTDVSDIELRPRIAQTLDSKKPREWYWALMDYGASLKTTQGNVSTRSRHYKKQSPLAGSRRQVRGQILKQLTTASQTKMQLKRHIPDERLAAVLADLLKEGLITTSGGRYSIGG